ncbi:T-protein [Methanobrevibacter cuticularis]|uniref:T-protein n=1 Tax=Methanobrevibacter cuticularis TaxID=47311 RepID=A0A166DNH8_9EURY|nr:prephenate dehydrogenase [Methanobrevibacter cuticularis]KZX15789.1 T-protein [Methanobrevibacter cuticularis]
MKVGIIGGTKGLGKTLAILLKKEGYDVTITGRDTSVGLTVSEKLGVSYSNDNKKTANVNDIVIVSVPIATTSAVIKEIANSMKKGSLLLDVTSVKEGPSNLMNELLDDDVEFIPTHPVFGPRTTNLNGQVIVLTPIKKGKWYPKVIDFLKKHKMRIIEASPSEHDKMMSIVQILTHFSYISTASAIKKLGISIKDTRKFASPIYGLMVDMISRIVSQNPILTYSIQLENENGENVRETFTESVLELKDVLTNQDEEKFVKIAIEATKNLDDIQAALGRSDKAIESLNHEISSLKNAVGKEIALKHIYSEEVHIGILTDLDPEFVTLNTKKGEKNLKIANIKILDEENLKEWKLINKEIKTQSISCVFPNSCNEAIIAQAISKLDEITDVKITDIYHGPQVANDKISITFEIDAFDVSAFENVETFLKGFGGIIR